jgi:quinol monooxygenase YgiN
MDYGLYQELDNPVIFTILDYLLYKSIREKHLKSNHFREIFPLLLECLKKNED